MAAKKNPMGSKSAFVRAHPDLVPGEVEAAAKEAGLDISAAYVSTIRSADRIKAGKGDDGDKRRGSSKGAPKRGSATGSAPGRKTEGISKSDFIRSQDDNMSANEVVEAAKAAGITMTPGLVYTVRGAAKAKSNRGARAGVAKPAATRGRPPSIARVLESGNGGGRISDHVKEVLRVAIAAAGIDGAAHLIEQARKRIDLIV